MIRQAYVDDAAAIAAIYNHYISHTVVTFEEDTLSMPDMRDRIVQTLAQGLPWLVAEREGEVTGYAYASKWLGRCAYRYSLEVTVYIAPTATGSGLGTKLYEALFDELRGGSFHVAIAGIALPNDPSIALHEKLGMEKVAHFSEVGFKFNRWIDVGYWQGKL